MNHIIGHRVTVDFPDFGVFGVVAKVDTGAYSGALHATSIKELVLPTGEKALTFKACSNKKAITVTDFHSKRVKSSNGLVSYRYVVHTTVVIGKVNYPIRITLSDRTGMLKPVLLGRTFLAQHGFLVDVASTTKYGSEVSQKK